MPTFHIETYGCQMNVADSELVAGLLAGEGYAPADDAAGADLVVVNTCSVREHAEKRVLRRITELANARRRQHSGQRLWVIGCMAQRLGERLRSDVPGVDRVIGAREIEFLHEHIRSYLEHAGPTRQRPAAGSPAVSAFVPVMRGCNNCCVYCVVPQVRGPEHSVPAADVLREVRQLVASGAREITLLGQNVNSYRDSATGQDFPSLLRELHQVDGLLRIRFTTSHPKDCSDELLRAVAELPRLCKHVHLPVQSGSSTVLAAMNRGYTRGDYLGRIDAIRRLMPGADITTDAMTGFPGETDRDFRETVALFRDVRFTTAFMFAFSARPGTAAAGMEGGVPAVVAKERLAELIALQTGITREIYGSMVGRSADVLFTERQRARGRQWFGQDHGCKRVLLACEQDVAGAILRVNVRRSTGMTLVAEREEP